MIRYIIIFNESREKKRVVKRLSGKGSKTLVAWKWTGTWGLEKYNHDRQSDEKKKGGRATQIKCDENVTRKAIHVN